MTMHDYYDAFTALDGEQMVTDEDARARYERLTTRRAGDDPFGILAAEPKDGPEYDKRCWEWHDARYERQVADMASDRGMDR